MTQPEPYSSFHILMLVIGIPVTVFLAWKTRLVSAHTHDMILLVLGILLILSEIYKQLFHFYIVDHHTYDWWIFPFQLCSLPMYISVIIPFVKKQKPKLILETFLMDICLLGGIMALLFPSGMMHSYVVLTWHSFLWHFILIFLGVHIALTKPVISIRYSYLWTAVLFLFNALVASMFNFLFHSYGNINMFYISSYRPMTQPIFMNLEPIIGRIPTILCYLICIVFGLFLVQHIVFHIQTKKKTTS